MNNGRKSNPCSLPKILSPREADLLPPTGKFWRASSGFCEREHPGKICPQNIPAHLPAGAASSAGQKKMFGCRHGELSSSSLTRMECWIGRKPSLTPASPGDKSVPAVGKTKIGKGSKWLVVVDGQGVPLGGTITLASPTEVTLAEEALETIKVPRQGRGRPKTRPKKLIGDKAYDSDKMRHTLAVRGISLLVPLRKNRKNKRKQSEKVWESCKRRWKVERTFAWLGNFRRLVLRYERSLTVYQGFFHLACIIIALRQF
jgi:transposase